MRGTQKRRHVPYPWPRTGALFTKWTFFTRCSGGGVRGSLEHSRLYSYSNGYLKEVSINVRIVQVLTWRHTHTLISADVNMNMWRINSY